MNSCCSAGVRVRSGGASSRLLLLLSNCNGCNAASSSSLSLSCGCFHDRISISAISSFLPLQPSKKQKQRLSIRDWRLNLTPSSLPSSSSATSFQYRSKRLFCSSSDASLSPPAQGKGEATTIVDSPPPHPPSESDPIKAAADALDIRVGRILKAYRHPEADSLYVEEVDIGEAEPRTICSGLVNYVPIEQLQVPLFVCK